LTIPNPRQTGDAAAFAVTPVITPKELLDTKEVFKHNFLRLFGKQRLLLSGWAAVGSMS
jgi:hypothetical protein